MSTSTLLPTPTLSGILESPVNGALKRYLWRHGSTRKYRSGTIEKVKQHLEMLLTYNELSKKRHQPRAWIAPVFIPLTPNCEEARMLREILDDRQAARELASAAGRQIGMVISLDQEGYNFTYGDGII